MLKTISTHFNNLWQKHICADIDDIVEPSEIKKFDDCAYTDHYAKPVTLYPNQKKQPFNYTNVIAVTLENTTDIGLDVPLFSNYKAIPEGIKVQADYLISDDEQKEFSDYNKTKYDWLIRKKIPQNPIFVHHARIKFDSIDNYFNSFNLIQRKPLGGRTAIEIMPLLYFTSTQYQSNSIDFSYPICFNGKNELVVRVLPKEKIKFVCYCDDIKNYVKPAKPNLVALSIHNTTSEHKRINLFDINNHEYQGIKIETPVGSFTDYKSILSEIANGKAETNVKYKELNKITVFSANSKQLDNDIRRVKQDDKHTEISSFLISQFVTAYDYQNTIICGNFSYDYNKNTHLEIVIEPNTKVIYVFYSGKIQKAYLTFE